MRVVYVLVPFVAALVLGGDHGKPAARPVPQSATPEVLERIDSHGLREWVKLDTSKAPDGSVEYSAVSQAIRDLIELHLRNVRPEDRLEGVSTNAPCEIQIGHASGSWPGPQLGGRVTLTEFAEVIVYGSVVSLTPGLRFGNPGTMVNVHVQGSPKGVYLAPTLSVFVPRVRFRLQGRGVCVSSPDPAPNVDDEVLVFLDAASSGKCASYVTSPPAVILLRSPKGQVRGPREIADTTAVRSFPGSSPLASLVRQLELMEE